MTDTPRPCGSEILNGVHSGTFQNLSCGCEAVGDGTLPHPFTVKACGDHNAMREALEDAIRTLEALARRYECGYLATGFNTDHTITKARAALEGKP